MKIAVLDDYQDVARRMADWQGLEATHEIVFFHEAYEGLDAFAERLAPFDILCVMRERSPIGRDLLERLPNIKLLATAGMRNAAIDMDYCKERGIGVVGTGGSAGATPDGALHWVEGAGHSRHREVDAEAQAEAIDAFLASIA